MIKLWLTRQLRLSLWLKIVAALLLLALAVFGFVKVAELSSDAILRLPDALLGVEDGVVTSGYSPSPLILEARAQEADRAALVWSIYGLESSYGKNDACIREGRGYNGFGLGWFDGNRPCYKTFNEVVSLVHAWIEDKQKANFTIPEILCRWNTGKKSDGCDYYNKYLALSE